MSAEDLGRLELMAQGDGELRVAKGLLRSLIAQAHGTDAADRTDAAPQRNLGNEQ